MVSACAGWTAHEATAHLAAAAATATAAAAAAAAAEITRHLTPYLAGDPVANQLMVAGNIGLLAEAIVFLEAHGVETGPAIEVLGGGLASSTVLDRKARSMLAREFTPGFRLNLHHKDLGIVQSAAREAGVVIPLGAVASQLVAALVARGDGDLDHSGLPGTPSTRLP